MPPRERGLCRRRWRARASAACGCRFLPDGPDVRVPPGVSLFDAASWNGVAIDSTCGGYGTCKKCKVRIVEGELPISSVDPRAFTPDELRDGWRLACRAQAACDLVIDVPPLQTRPKAATVGVGRQVILRPSVQKRYLELERADAAGSGLRPRAHPAGDGRPRAARRRRRRAHAAAARAQGRLEGHGRRRRRRADRRRARRHDGRACSAIAFDLGTTTVVATLLDLSTGTPVAVRSILNRQQPYGADVIRRISATMMDPTVLDRSCRPSRTRRSATSSPRCCEQGGVEPDEVYEVALAGNATMTELAARHRPRAGRRRAVHHGRVELPADARRRLRRRRCTRARTRTSSPRSAPTSAATSSRACWPRGMTRDKRLRLFIDVGTNCEIALGNVERAADDRRAGGAGLRGRPDPLRHARRRRRDRDHPRQGRRASSSASSATRRPSASAARASSTRSPSSSSAACSTPPAAS